MHPHPVDSKRSDERTQEVTNVGERDLIWRRLVYSLMDSSSIFRQNSARVTFKPIDIRLISESAKYTV